MTKEQMIDIIRLLSALEAAGLISQRLPDYLLDDITKAVELLTHEVLK